MRKKCLILFLFILPVLSSWFLVWKFYRYAKILESSNFVYLQERNKILLKLASAYNLVSEIEVILKKLGLSAKTIQERFEPLFEKEGINDSSLKLDQNTKEQIASLLLVQYTPLDTGISLVGQVFPELEMKIGGVLRHANDFESLYAKLKLNLQRLPSILPAIGKIKSLFGYRQHPIYGEKSFHAGIDIANAPGTPVIAAAEGEIIWTGDKGDYGTTIIIRHSPVIKTQYSHLKEVKVRIGQMVERGEVIGSIGSSGFVTGPHLHYEVQVRGKPQNPLSFVLN